MSDADELDDELLAVAGRPRQTPGKRRRQAAEDSDEDGMLSEVGTTFSQQLISVPLSGRPSRWAERKPSAQTVMHYVTA